MRERGDYHRRGLPDRAHFYFRDPAAPKPTRPRVLGIIALIERDGEVLLERRTDSPLWSLIGGKVEDDESLVEALHREVLEETGLRVIAQSLFGTFSDPTRIAAYPDGNIWQIASVAYTTSVETFERLRPSSESEELRFFPTHDLANLEMPATQRPVVARLVSDRSPPHLD